MVSSVVLKKMVRVLKKKECIAESRAAIEELKKDKDIDVVTAANAEY